MKGAYREVVVDRGSRIKSRGGECIDWRLDRTRQAVMAVEIALSG